MKRKEVVRNVRVVNAPRRRWRAPLALALLGAFVFELPEGFVATIRLDPPHPALPQAGTP